MSSLRDADPSRPPERPYRSIRVQTPATLPGGAASPGRSLFVAGFALGALVAFLGYRLYLLRFEADVEFLRQVRDLTAATYVDEVDPALLVDEALHGMIEGLDRYSRYYGPEDIALLDRETTGEFWGIGVVFRAPIAAGQVLFPFPDSPAARAGVRVGDRILELDGRSVAQMPTGELQRTIQTCGDRDLPARVLGLDGVERDLVLRPERVIDPTVRHARLLPAPDAGLGGDEGRIEGGGAPASVGYLAITSFSHRTPEEFDRAADELLAQGATALVLDLRDNPGGILEAAVRIANRFVAEGTLVATRTRSETQVKKALPSEARLAGVPLVLLVDGGSASASEVLAGALQDHGVAPLVGEPTYGKGTVQTLTRFGEDRAIVKLTTAKYFTPSWRRIERNGPEDGEHGIMPDLLVELDDTAEGTVHRHLASYSPPVAVLPAIEAWQAEEREELFARPPVDPQLQAALDLLRGVPPPAHALPAAQ